jgi:hypothetical protein
MGITGAAVCVCAMAVLTKSSSEVVILGTTQARATINNTKIKKKIGILLAIFPLSVTNA